MSKKIKVLGVLEPYERYRVLVEELKNRVAIAREEGEIPPKPTLLNNPKIKKYIENLKKDKYNSINNR